MKMPIEKLTFGVGRPEEWIAWAKFLRIYEGTVDELPKWGTLWSLKLLHDDIKENGTTNPTIIESGGRVLVGNQRLLVQKVLGYTEVECEVDGNKIEYKETHYDRVRKSP